MDALEFVSELKKIPNKERISQLKKIGLDEGFIEEYIGCYTFKQIGNKKIDNPIGNLANNYDGTSVAIGMITFDINWVEDDSYFFFGKFEVDLLAINKKTGEIKLLDHENLEYVMQDCALNGSNFLCAILKAATFLEKLPYDENLANDQKQICEMAIACSNIAGGDKYLGFYKTLLGCFE